MQGELNPETKLIGIIWCKWIHGFYLGSRHFNNPQSASLQHIQSQTQASINWKQLRFIALAFLLFLVDSKPIVAGTLSDTLYPKKKDSFWRMTFGFQDRAADFEENLFKDPQLLLNASVIHSSYNFQEYFTDEWLLQENDYRLTVKPNLLDASRKFKATRLSLDLTGSFLFFYAGFGIIIPQTYQQISLGNGKEFYTNDSTRYFADIRKGSFWKAGLNLHFRRWVISAGMRGYQGPYNSSVMAQSIKTGEIKKMTSAGSGVFNNFFELGIRYQNFTIGFERALNIDFSGAECNSIFIGYNLFDLRNYNEKRIPR